MAEKDSLPNAPQEHTSTDQEIEDFFASISGVIKAASRPLPTQTGDGTYITPPSTNGVFDDILHTRFKDWKTLLDAGLSEMTGGPVNDKTYLMERIVQCASSRKSNSKIGTHLSDQFIDTLWDDLPHPPMSYLGDQYAYREADGSNNNYLFPKLGAANTPYAKNVRPQTLMPANLPEAGVLFDTVMVRKRFKQHPNEISSMLFYLASIIIHDLFRTSHGDPNISKTSSYLDLAPLYGSNQHDQNLMRTLKGGKIKADCFSEKRLLGFPPGVGVLLIMFNRFHNYVVEQLALINEAGRFTKPKEGLPDEQTKKAWAKYDNDLFQTGRLITCGLYVNVILKDYVRTILGLTDPKKPWDLDPRIQVKKKGAAQGTGNQVSAEFNLIYRWHAAISERDDKWTNEAYSDMFPGKDPKTLTLPELLQGLGEWEQGLPEDPQQRPFAKLHRGPDNTLDDAALVEILTASVKDVAGSFGANNVPEILRAVEILGIKQGRSWNLATLNELRSFFNLAKHETFESINSDKDVVEQLKHLYDTPDHVELYPGVVIEEAKQPMIGSGLCASFTTARAILSDATALVRGDRFYTIDYTPKNLTSWGYNEVSSDTAVDGGHVLYKLFLRAFPNYFQPNSVYAHFPFHTPSKNQEILTKLEIDNEYNFDPPALIPPLVFINSHKAARDILSNQKDFKVTWGTAIKYLMHNDGKEYGSDFMLAGDDPPNAKSRGLMDKALYRDKWHDEIQKFYEEITLKLLHQNSYKLAGVNQVDIVRDIGNLAQVHFSAGVFNFPLKTEEYPTRLFSEQELYLIMAMVFICIFFDADPAKSFPLRQAARNITKKLGETIEAMVGPMAPAHESGFFPSRFHKHSPLSQYGMHMVQELLKSGLGVKDVVWSQILPTAGGMVANQAQLFAQTLDYYLSEEAEPHLKEINRLAKLDTPEADETILRYFLEGSRMRATVGLYRDVANAIPIEDGSKTLNLKPGQRVMVNCIAASMDPDAFPEPEKVDLKRPLDSYIHYGMGPHSCLGYEASKVAMMTMLKTVGKLDRLRRAPGKQGEIQKVVINGFTMYMTADHSSYFPFPTTMKVQWDGELPPLKN
ncbi:MAG: fatty acid oxygenase [Lasallia pustulata]|uniref:Fatty acid oxygenase n=1 Tax=Lasallia pustulata TaxID=136370 RepID=A0A5M8PXY4_9LECA|nr:MAG: fatty acid oxygenase [Lasallia pustulata]